MVKQLGPILFIALLGGNALAQEPPSITVRLGTPSLVPSPVIVWGTDRLDPPRPEPLPPLADRPFSSPVVSVLLALTEAF